MQAVKAAISVGGVGISVFSCNWMFFCSINVTNNKQFQFTNYDNKIFEFVFNCDTLIAQFDKIGNKKDPQPQSRQDQGASYRPDNFFRLRRCCIRDFLNILSGRVCIGCFRNRIPKISIPRQLQKKNEIN